MWWPADSLSQTLALRPLESVIFFCFQLSLECRAAESLPFGGSGEAHSERGAVGFEGEERTRSRFPGQGGAQAGFCFL
jgi:hypothetical protein